MKKLYLLSLTAVAFLQFGCVSGAVQGEEVVGAPFNPHAQYYLLGAAALAFLATGFCVGYELGIRD